MIGILRLLRERWPEHRCREHQLTRDQPQQRSFKSHHLTPRVSALPREVLADPHIYRPPRCGTLIPISPGLQSPARPLRLFRLLSSSAAAASCCFTRGVPHGPALVRPARYRHARKPLVSTHAGVFGPGANQVDRRIPAALGRGRGRSSWFLGEARQGRATLVRAVFQGARVERTVRRVVRRRQDQRLLQLPRSPRGRGPRRSRRPVLGRRARRCPAAHLRRAASRGVQVRQRAEVARHPARRRGVDLHAAHAGAGDRHARLRADRGDPLRDLCRLLGRGDRRPQQRRESQAADHGRRRLAPRADSAAQANRG